MDPAYEELEKDILEKHGAPRVWQEMAKNPALPGDNVVSSHEGGIHPKKFRAKIQKTFFAIEAKITQTRRGKEG